MKNSDNSIFELQWEILLKEIDINKSTIEQMHEFGQKIKNWTILIWSMAISGSLTNEKYIKYSIFIIAIPLLFWFVESAYRKIQSKFIYRMTEIKEFVNSDSLVISKTKGQFENFQLLDLLGSNTKSKKYLKITSFKSIIFFKSLYIFYGSLSLFTVIIWCILNFLKY